MSLKIKYEVENNNNENIISLGNEEIKSILATQSQAVFEDKNISNNSNFVKKSLIEIALDFKAKEVKENENSNDITNLNNSSDTLSNQQVENINEIDDNKKIEEIKKLENTNESELNTERSDKENISNDDKFSNELENVKHNEPQDIPEKLENIEVENNKDFSNQELNEDKSPINNLENIKSEENITQETKSKVQETQQALDSVRNAVSQSINNTDNETTLVSDDVSNIITKDIDNFKNIFSSLSSLSEQAIYEVMENKILDIANELAGYQIDKMPEKYEKKIKSFLKNINCFEEKITIEVNDKDYNALSKIESFNENEKSRFTPNKDISRGDIILNCDGMYYSETTVKKD